MHPLNSCPQVPGCLILSFKKNAAQKFYSLQPTLRLETAFVFLSDEKKGRLSLNHVIEVAETRTSSSGLVKWSKPSSLQEAHGHL